MKEFKGIPRLMVFNKVDLVNPLWAKAIANRFSGVLCSAIRPATFGELLREIERRVWPEADKRSGDRAGDNIVDED